MVEVLGDGIKGTTRNQSPFRNSIYSLGNCQLHQADFGSVHCDRIQLGGSGGADGANDEYYLQSYGDIFLGDTHSQWPSMSTITQNEGPTSFKRMQMDFRDCVLLGTGTRGIWAPDRRLTVDRVMMGWPPLDGPVPTSGTGWNGGPYVQTLKGSGSLGSVSDTNIGLYWAGRDAFSDGFPADWIPYVSPAVVIDHRDALGGPDSYDTHFPNMDGQLSFNGSTLIIPQYTGAYVAADIRAWLSNLYQPAGGWEAAGFRDPAGWF